jgi:CRP-like cAMP-binding protein
MLAVVELSPEAAAIERRSRKAAAALAAGLQRTGAISRRRLARDEDLLGSGARGHALLHEGLFRLSCGTRPVRMFEAGDLAPCGSREELAGFRLASESAAHVSVFDAAALARAVADDAELAAHALEFHACEQALLFTLCAALVDRAPASALELREIPEGDTIVREGEPADELFQMLSGEARVTLEGVDLDHVGEEETFGELSLLAGVPRLATVTAFSDCVVQVVRACDLPALLRGRPRLAEDMARGLARRLASADHKLAARRG